MTTVKATKTDWQVTRDLIIKFKLGSLIREFLSADKPMGAAVFCEKLHEKRTYHFTDLEKEKITKYLLSMGKILVNSLA